VSKAAGSTIPNLPAINESIWVVYGIALLKRSMGMSQIRKLN
jgi:hypothetical protein